MKANYSIKSHNVTRPNFLIVSNYTNSNQIYVWGVWDRFAHTKLDIGIWIVKYKR
jgi:hypothetical protein